MNKGEIYYISKEAVDDKNAYVIQPGRPAIIVSTASINSSQNIVSVVFLTSKPKLDSPAHFITRCKGVTGTALCEEIVTIDKSYVGKYVGTLTHSELEKLNECLKYVLDLETTEYIEAENITSLQEEITKLEKRVALYENIITRLTKEES